MPDVPRDMGIVADDKYGTASSGGGPVDGPIRRILAITAGAGELAFYPRAVWVGTAGNLTIVDAAGVTTTLNNVAAGVWHYFRPVQITAATAVNIRIGD